MNKRALAFALVLLTSSIIVAGILLDDLGKGNVSDIKLYTYPLADGDKTFIVTLETNWTEEPEPKVTLINSSDPNQYAIELYFHGGTEKTITYNITIPTDLLGGDISLIWKYYLQDPDRYTLSNNSTHNSLQMTFDYNPYFSGRGYFVIKGTEGVIA
jgi:hypothetical protein